MFKFRRYSVIIFEFTRFALIILLHRLLRFIPFLRRRAVDRSFSPPRLLRQILERLGATFVKFGQLMAMRPDLLPPNYINELSKLLDQVPSFDSNTAISIIEKELGESITDIFPVFDEQPIAAASFSQVHKARLKDGELVAIKIQRPNLLRVVQADVQLVNFFATLIDLSGIMNRVKVRPLVDDFAQWTYEELDYVVEATYAERLRQNSVENPNQHIPKIYWQYTTSKILTLEFLEGVWVSDILDMLAEDDLVARQKLTERGIDLVQVAQNIFYNGLRQAFDEKLFHADPHAGNLVVLENNVIGYVDFGIIGQLDEDFRSNQLYLLNALQQEKPDRYFNGVLKLMTPPPENLDLAAFKDDVKQNMRDWQNAFYNPKATLSQRSSSWLFTRNLLTARQYGLSFSELAVRYYRALSVAELILLRLDDTFDFRTGLRVFLTKLGLRTIVRENTPAEYVQSILRINLLLRNMPDTVEDLLDYVKELNPSIRTAVSGFRQTLGRLIRAICVIDIIALVLVLFLRLLFPQTYARFIPYDWLPLSIVLLILIPFWIWLSRQFFISSVQKNKLVSLNRPRV